MRLDRYFFLKKNNFSQLLFLIIPRIFNFIKTSTKTSYGTPPDFFIYFNINNIHFLTLFLKNSSFFKFSLLGDISIVDLLSPILRFKISYNLLGLFIRTRIFLTSFLSSSQFINSLQNIFKSSV